MPAAPAAATTFDGLGGRTITLLVFVCAREVISCGLTAPIAPPPPPICIRCYLYMLSAKFKVSRYKAHGRRDAAKRADEKKIPLLIVKPHVP